MLRHDAGRLATALDVHTLADVQPRHYRLCHGHQHAAAGPNDHLLARHGLVVLLLNLVPGDRTTYRADHHCHVASGSAANEAADADAG